MINISNLYLGAATPSDAIRYGGPNPTAAAAAPVVVWNATRACNLNCSHCYAAAEAAQAANELSAAECTALVRQAAELAAPALLFSGGEPMLRPDIFELLALATRLGIHAVLSTNGTLITPQAAARLKAAGCSYVGISIDGARQTHDRLRHAAGAFDAALAGLRACRDAGLKTGIRFTILRDNAGEIEFVFRLAREERIPRLCFYHLVYAGRGANLAAAALSPSETRNTLDRIIDCTAALFKDGLPAEVLTVDNRCDGPYIYLRMLKERNPFAERALTLLRRAARRRRPGIVCVGWDGTVYPDQFWRTHPLGNIREKPLNEILAAGPMPCEASKRLPGRCRQCRFLDVCGGNSRARAEAATADPWGQDPACYLTDTEIAGEQ